MCNYIWVSIFTKKGFYLKKKFFYTNGQGSLRISQLNRGSTILYSIYRVRRNFENQAVLSSRLCWISNGQPVSSNTDNRL